MTGRTRCLVASALALLATTAPAQVAPGGASHGAEPEAWPVAGRQGLIRIVIVPEPLLRDQAAYQRQIRQLCGPPDQSCFINFYGNSRGVPATLPLPDAIANEATVIFRRSIKQGAELFSWSCRLQVDPQRCF